MLKIRPLNGKPRAPARRRGSVGRKMRILEAATEREIDDAFVRITEERLGGLFVTTDQYFTTHRNQLAALAARHTVPAAYPHRDFTEAGGLISYGSDPNVSLHQQGVYVGRYFEG